jgi:hypothetical protein
MTYPSRWIVQKLGTYCNVLRGGGLSYGGYVEQELRPPAAILWGLVPDL